MVYQNQFQKKLQIRICSTLMLHALWLQRFIEKLNFFIKMVMMLFLRKIIKKILANF